MKKIPQQKTKEQFYSLMPPLKEGDEIKSPSTKFSKWTNHLNEFIKQSTLTIKYGKTSNKYQILLKQSTYKPATGRFLVLSIPTKHAKTYIYIIRPLKKRLNAFKEHDAELLAEFAIATLVGTYFFGKFKDLKENVFKHNSRNYRIKKVGHVLQNPLSHEEFLFYNPRFYTAHKQHPTTLYINHWNIYKTSISRIKTQNLTKEYKKPNATLIGYKTPKNPRKT